jgi:Ig-like domain-containing protein
MVFTAMALFLAACAAPPPPAPTPTSAQISAPSSTPIPVLSPTATQTAPVESTPAVIPAFTATSEPTLPVLLPTFFFSPPTPTSLAARDLDCKVVMQSVADGTHFRPNERFSMGWIVINTGKASWFPASVVFTFVGGQKMYQYPETHLQGSVGPGEQVGLFADLRAPKNSTTYTTVWALRRGTDVFCPVRVTIWVEEQ